MPKLRSQLSLDPSYPFRIDTVGAAEFVRCPWLLVTEPVELDDDLSFACFEGIERADQVAQAIHGDRHALDGRAKLSAGAAHRLSSEQTGSIPTSPCSADSGHQSVRRSPRVGGRRSTRRRNTSPHSFTTAGTSSGLAWHKATITTVPNTVTSRRNGDNSSNVIDVDTEPSEHAKRPRRARLAGWGRRVRQKTLDRLQVEGRGHTRPNAEGTISPHPDKETWGSNPRPGTRDMTR